MPQAPECRMCGELMELRIVRAPHPEMISTYFGVLTAIT
jgi:hypothetical protein